MSASSPPRSILRVGWAYAPTIKRATASGNRGGCGRGRTGWRLRCGWRRGRCNARHSALGAYFRRMNSRLGFKGAITATAHKLARYVYAMLKHGEAYVSQRLEQYEAATQERIERTLRKKARALGYDPVPRQPLSPAVS